MSYLYGFMAASIQSYIMGSSRLRDIQGASQLVDELCRVDFPRVQEQVAPDAQPLSAAAGGARITCEDKGQLDALYEIWPAIAAKKAPGLLIQEAMVEYSGDSELSNAHAELSQKLRQARNDPPRILPELPPIAWRNPRTGEGVSDIVKVRVSGIVKEVVTDRITEAKVKAWRDTRQEGAESSLERGFIREGLDVSFERRSEQTIDDTHDWQFDEGAYVAVIHADGNDIGAVLQGLAGDQFREFSEALDGATKEAARMAVERVLAPHDEGEEREGMPARPILLGGDDMTIIVRADLALDFTKTYLRAFSEQSAKKMAGIPGVDRLTASAGIAFVKQKFPFDRASELAESLCRRAKVGAKAHSALAFHKVTTSLPGDAQRVLAEELTHGDLQMTFGQYTIEPTEGHAAIDDLENLVKALHSMAHGPVRGLASLLEGSLKVAEQKFRRLMCVERERPGDTAARFETALETLTGNETQGEQFLKKEGGERTSTPLYDAIQLWSLGRRSQENVAEEAR